MGRASQAFTQTASGFRNLKNSLQFRSGGEKTKMRLSSALGFALLLAIVILLVVPEAESKSIRPHRGALARRAMGRGGGGGGRRSQGEERTDVGVDGRTKSPKLTWCRTTEDPGMEEMSARFSCLTVGTGLTA